MEQITVFEPVDYIDSEAVAKKYLANARNEGGAALLASAHRDVVAVCKSWFGRTQKSDANMTSPVIFSGRPRS
jgi:hypothetical protein